MNLGTPLPLAAAPLRPCQLAWSEDNVLAAATATAVHLQVRRSLKGTLPGGFPVLKRLDRLCKFMTWAPTACHAQPGAARG